MKIYLPTYNENQCAIIKDKDTIRVYDQRPQNINENYTYTDYFYNSHYYTTQGVENITENVICIDNENITTEVYYRNDLPDILFIFIILFIIGIILPLKLFSRFFRRLL